MIMHCFACDTEFDAKELDDQPEIDLRLCTCPNCGRSGYIIDVWFGGKSGIHHGDLCEFMKEFRMRCECINSDFEDLSNSEELYEANEKLDSFEHNIIYLTKFMDMLKSKIKTLREDLN